MGEHPDRSGTDFNSFFDGIEHTDADVQKFVETLAGKKQNSLLHSSEVTPTTSVVEAGAHKAADAVTMHWSSDAPSVEFAPTFSSLPKEVQNSVKKDQQGKAKAVFHPDSNSIWVILDKHVNQADVEESLYHEGGHWGTLTELGKDSIAALDRSFDKLGVPMMSKIAKEHGFEKQFAADLKEFNDSKKTPEDRARLVAELLAGVAQKKPYREWHQKLKDAVKELIGQLRNWLKKK